VLIVIDTLRGDRLGCSGDAPAVTPTLDSLAVTGTRFADAMTPVPVTLPAVSSLLTGRLPFHHGARDNDAFVLDPDETTLAERFRKHGWRTGAVVASAVLNPDRGLARGFETYDADFRGPYPVYDPVYRKEAEEFATNRRRANTVTDLALKELDRFGDRRFFLFVHYFDVHMVYDPPPNYAALHPGNPYDGEISFVDAEIGRLLAAVRQHSGVLTVVTADHGESQGEHGEPQHGFLLYQSTLHVPLIASGPGVPKSLVRRDLVSLVDLTPTLARIFDLGDAAPPADGRALAWNRPDPSPPIEYAETFRTLVSYRWKELRAARLGHWKLIRGNDDRFYDLAEDPGEIHPLAAAPDAARLRRFLDTISDDDPPAAVLTRAAGRVDPARREMLESLGYVGAADAPASAGAAYPDPETELPAWTRLQVSKTMLLRAQSLLEAGQGGPGTALVDSVLARNPDLAEAWYVRGLARVRLAADTTGARADFRACLERDPRHLGAHRELALLAGASGDDAGARAEWERVHELDATDPDALIHLAEWHLHRGEFESALPYLRSLADQKPDDPSVRFDLALAAHRAGHAEEAEKNFRTYLRLDPEGETADEVRKLLGED
jgi:choline-sulfatase